MRPVDKVLERLDGVHEADGSWRARCPAHDDREPSLSISLGDDGRALLKCFAGCKVGEVVSELGLEMSDLYPESVNGRRNGKMRRRIAETYDYTDEDGNLLFQTVRFEPKDFRQRRPNGRGDWEWNLKGIVPVLYHLPEVSRAVESGKTVFLCEGEKDTDRVWGLGAAATTSPMGAGKWRDSYSETLRGARVVIIPDNDLPGKEHAERVAASLQNVGAKVKVLELPDLPEKGDVSDWMDAGGTVEVLVRLADEACVWEPTSSESESETPLGVLLSEIKPERVSWLWKSRIPYGKLTLIDGDPGLGKSAMTTDLAARVSVGRMWPDGFECELGGTVICSAEDGLSDTIRPRFDAAGGDASKVIALSTVPDAAGNERALAIPHDLGVLRRAIDRVNAKLVIVDPLMAFLSGEVNSHRDQDVRRALVPLAKLAEDTGAAIVVVRHLNQARGGNPLYRGQGSIGIVGAARSALLVGEHPEDEDLRVLAPQKSNLAAEAASLAFALVGTEDDVVCVEWKGKTNHSAAGLLAAPCDPEERSSLDEAREFLRDALREGPVWSVQLKKDARSADVADATLRRAKSNLGVRSEKQSDGKWAWKMPDDEQGAQAAHAHKDEHLEYLPIDKPNSRGNQGDRDERLANPRMDKGNLDSFRGQGAHVYGDGRVAHLSPDDVRAEIARSNSGPSRAYEAYLEDPNCERSQYFVCSILHRLDIPFDRRREFVPVVREELEKVRSGEENA